jgi:methyl-accepting chemotaxis protein
VAQSKSNTANQVQSVVHDFETNLDTLIRSPKRTDRSRLIDQLRDRASSFDDQITATIQTEDPALSKATTDLQLSSEKVLQTLSTIQEENWNAVQRDHRQARQLLHRAEWALSIVSGLTFILSVWISFVLPRQLVQPLLGLKQAVDLAISDGHEGDLNVCADGELGQLAQSIRRLIAHLRTVHPVHK